MKEALFFFVLFWPNFSSDLSFPFQFLSPYRSLVIKQFWRALYVYDTNNEAYPFQSGRDKPVQQNIHKWEYKLLSIILVVAFELVLLFLLLLFVSFVLNQFSLKQPSGPIKFKSRHVAIPSEAVFLGLSLALRPNDQFQTYHWPSLLPHPPAQ